MSNWKTIYFEIVNFQYQKPHELVCLNFFTEYGSCNKFLGCSLQAQCLGIGQFLRAVCCTFTFNSVLQIVLFICIKALCVLMHINIRSVDKELVGWSQPKGSGQRLNVQMEMSDKWCGSGVHLGTSAV